MWHAARPLASIKKIMIIFMACQKKEHSLKDKRFSRAHTQELGKLLTEMIFTVKNMIN